MTTSGSVGSETMFLIKIDTDTTQIDRQTDRQTDRRKREAIFSYPGGNETSRKHKSGRWFIVKACNNKKNGKAETHLLYESLKVLFC